MDQKINDLRLFGRMLIAEVDKRGGRVEIPDAALDVLLTRGWTHACVGEALEFTLKDDDGVRRDVSVYSDQALYRPNVLMKYLILTSPTQALTFTDDDLAGELKQLRLHPYEGGLLAQTDAISPEAKEGDRTFIVKNNRVMVFDDLPKTPQSKPN